MQSPTAVAPASDTADIARPGLVGEADRRAVDGAERGAGTSPKRRVGDPVAQIADVKLLTGQEPERGLAPCRCLYRSRHRSGR